MYKYEYTHTDKEVIMLEIDCRKCVNCTGEECIPFGKDADVAVKKCAEDNFRNYVTFDELEKLEK